MAAKRTREEIQAELDALDAEEDDGDEVEIGNKDGQYFRGSFRRAAEVAGAWGIKLKADPPKTDDKGGDGKKPARVSVLSPRRSGTSGQ